MNFAQGVGVPCVLFLGVANLDLSQDMALAPFLAFYVGAMVCFVVGIAARVIFGRPGPDAVAIGFVCLFSNTLLLGLPITERAYGTAALTTNYALIALHSPLMYAFGITAMEVVKTHGQGLALPSVLAKMVGVWRAIRCLSPLLRALSSTCCTSPCPALRWMRSSWSDPPGYPLPCSVWEGCWCAIVQTATCGSWPWSLGCR